MPPDFFQEEFVLSLRVRYPEALKSQSLIPNSKFRILLSFFFSGCSFFFISRRKLNELERNNRGHRMFIN